MTKVRIYELARELDVNSKDLIDKAVELGYDIKNHMSALENHEVEKLKASFAPAKKQALKHKQRQRPGSQKSAHQKAKPKESKPKESKPKESSGPVVIEPTGHTVGELEKIFKIPSTALIKSLMSLGVMAGINQHLDLDTIEILAAQMDIEYIVNEPEDPNKKAQELKGSTAEDAEERAPVVTVMGHVDHGKTSLLDSIRKANVTASEAGGITQHIGAYRVEHGGNTIVFLDTPGHEAFTAMRARGTRVTDVAILVVAADEGVMPQTVEALNHAKAAEVPIIVALNKMDKPGANPDRVKQQLSQHNLMPEEWGGDTIYVEVSALSGDGIENMLEMINLVSEMLELKASASSLAEGTVIEAQLDRNRGPVATILVQQGTLSVGDPLVCGGAYGKVRAMFNDRGQKITSAGPSVPVEILGLSDVPNAGDLFHSVPDDKSARVEAETFSDKRRETKLTKSMVSLEDVFAQMSSDQLKELNLVVKTDVQGTTEALKQSLGKVNVKDITVNIVHDGVGAINSSDVMLASASGAIIIGFNVRPDTAAQKLAEEEKVEIRLYRVIYDVIDDVKAALEGLLEPEFKESVIGRLEVRSIFKHSKIGTVAGSYVVDGKITNHSSGRLLRDGVIIYEGKISSLKRFKEDVKEVNTGYECGVMLENYNDIKEGDQIEAYIMVEDK